MTTRRTTAIAWVAGLLVLAGCSSSGGPGRAAPADTSSTQSSTTSTTRPRVLPGHTAWISTFTDTARPAVSSTGTRAPSRTLATAIYRPNGNGPFPLVMFSHGLSGHPEKFTKLLSAWANAGYVVAAPAFPLTNSHVEDSSANLADGTEQPADVSFVLDNVLALNNDPKSRLFRAIDESRIGAAGLSLGGFTTYELVYGKSRDLRIKAAEVLDGFDGSVSIDGHVPLLIAHSDSDPAIRYSSAQDRFRTATAPVWFVTLHGASHASEWENPVTPYDHIAERVTTDFWNATLNRDPQSFLQLRRDATVPGLSSIMVKRGTVRST